jgi:predicted nucleotide-binding protein
MARKPSPPLTAPKLQLTPDEKRTAVARLSGRLQALESFDVRAMKENRPPDLIALQTSITRELERAFGENTADFKHFKSAGELAWMPFLGALYIGGSGKMPAPTPLSEYQKGVGNNINRSKELLKEALRSLEEDLAETVVPVITHQTAQTRDLSKVFVVHGHDGEVRQTVARFIEKLGLDAIILHERPNKGRTIITKFREEAADVGFAVVLMTPDDIGSNALGHAAPLPRARARQNVVFELGFFIGALGPQRVAALVKGEIERPSDFDGVVYISLDGGNWQMELGRELKEAGYAIDWNKVMG